MPKEPPATVASLRHKSYRTPPHQAQAEADSAGSERRSDRDAIPPLNNSKDTPERREPTDETHRAETRTAADRTRSDGQTHRQSDQTEDANAQHKSTAKATANRANERRRQRSKKTTSNQALELATYNTQQSCLSVSIL